MTKQQEIREGIVEPVCEACLPYICAHWELAPQKRLQTCEPLNKWVDRILKIEADLGVVIKMDRELPWMSREEFMEWCGSQQIKGCGSKRNMCDDYCRGLAQIGKAGYEAVEDLIEKD